MKTRVHRRRGGVGTGMTIVVLAVGFLLSAGTSGHGTTAFSIQQDREEIRAEFEAAVEVAQIQIRVTDEEGGFVPDLSVEDFRVETDGKERRIASLYPVDLNTVLGEQFPETGPPPAAWRQFLLFFDMAFATPRGILRAREAALEFLDEQVQPTDLVAVASFSQLYGIRILTPFSRDRATVRRVVESLGIREHDRAVVDPAGFTFDVLTDQFDDTPGQSAAPEQDNPVAGAAQELLENQLRSMVIQGRQMEEQQYASVVLGFIRQLERFASTLRAVRGKKHMILFSQGFADRILAGSSIDEMARDSQIAAETGAIWQVQRNRYGQYNYRPRLDDALELLAAAGAVIHSFDISGLQNRGSDITSRDGRIDTDTSREDGQTTLLYLSENTGGTVHWNTNQIADALAELEASTRTYYVLSYYTEPGDGDTVELDISVDRPDVKVVAPKKFARPPDYTHMEPLQRQLQLAEFVAKQFDVRPIRFDLTSCPFPGERGVARLAVLFEVPIGEVERLLRERSADRIDLELFGYVTDADGQMRDFFTRTLQLDARAVESARSSGNEVFRYYDLLWANAGDYLVRGILREAEIGQISSRTSAGTVPRYQEDRLVVSGPVFLPSGDPGLWIRGFDHDSPPARRAGGPVEYPFVLGDRVLMPEVSPELTGGSTFRVFLVAYNFDRDRETGVPSAGVEMLITAPSGTPYRVRDLRLLGQHYDPERGAQAMVLEGRVPEAIEGPSQLWIRVIDDLAGTTVDRRVPLDLGPGRPEA